KPTTTETAASVAQPRAKSPHRARRFEADRAAPLLRRDPKAGEFVSRKFWMFSKEFWSHYPTHCSPLQAIRGSGFKVQGSGFCSGFRVRGSGFGVGALNPEPRTKNPEQNPEP